MRSAEEMFDARTKAYKAERALEYRKWVDEIPKLEFHKDWVVKIIPPFGGAIVRFLVFSNGVQVSVYLDCYENLGIFWSPYWEVCPYNNDVFRCGIKDTDALMNAIRESINERTQ